MQLLKPSFKRGTLAYVNKHFRSDFSFTLNLKVKDSSKMSAEGACENFRIFFTGTVYDVIIFKFQGGNCPRLPSPSGRPWFTSAVPSWLPSYYVYHNGKWKHLLRLYLELFQLSVTLGCYPSYIFLVIGAKKHGQIFIFNPSSQPWGHAMPVI